MGRGLNDMFSYLWRCEKAIETLNGQPSGLIYWKVEILPVVLGSC
jgi:hypothetical protein